MARRNFGTAARQSTAALPVSKMGRYTLGFVAASKADPLRVPSSHEESQTNRGSPGSFHLTASGLAVRSGQTRRESAVPSA